MTARRPRRPAALLLAALALATLPAAARAQTAAAPDIAFTVSMPEPHTHLLQVEIRVRAGGQIERGGAALPAPLDLVMPVWTPGSYLVREYERHVQDFAATDGAGRALAWRKVNKNTWRVETGGAAREVRAAYRVYANELSVRTNELNDRHAFWNNAALLMHVAGHLRAPATVRVVPRADWRVASALPEVKGQTNTFRADNFDVLYDAPFEVSDFKTLAFEVRGVPHRLVIDGEGNYDPERVRRDTQKIVEAAAALMGEIPYRDYTFFVHLRPQGGGGLEHLNSTALIVARYGFRPEMSYRGFLTLVAHEFFHAWNVKRIRPDALGPFDYTQENYTRLLWVAEGVTSYYENILVRRAGLMTDKDYLDQLARDVQTLQRTPGRREVSVEESSFDAWIKQYRPDENQINSTVSYYDKGAILGALLDLEIRRRSNGARALDDVLRHLYTEFYKRERNYTPEDFQRVCEQMAGASLDDFFSRYVRGREELDYERAFGPVGLQLLTAATRPDGSPPPPRAHFGANLRQDNDRLVVTSVPSDTPAYAQGINAGDQIVALDGQRATLAFFNARLDERQPGDEIALTVFRGEDLRAFKIKLGARPDENYRLVPVKNPTPEQARLYEAWLGAPLVKGN
ncbi:MAG TPA: PDZ domain-containing protein [Pyrinomonadaceae bacterium]